MGITEGIAQNQITLQDIWENGTFSARSIPGFTFMKDGRQYTRQQNNSIVAYDITTGDKTQVLFDPAHIRGFDGQFSSYSFSEDEKQILIATEHQQVYRRSFLANYFIFNRQTRKVSPLYENQKTMNAYFSPDGKHAGFVYQNNLFYKDLTTGKTTQITHDGEEDAIINGAADWVYEEEFALTRAYEWSPDSRYIAWIRFDERAVPEFTMTNYTGKLYPDYDTFKYPKVGEKNSIVNVFIYDTEKKTTKLVDIGTRETDLYIPRIKWTGRGDELIVFLMNRHQNNLKLLLANRTTGISKLLLEEKSNYYLDIHDNLTFLPDHNYFLWTSEEEGFNQIYLYDFIGNKKKITTDQNEITQVYGVDPVRNRVYYQATTDSPLERAVYSIDLDGKNKVTLQGRKGWNNATFSTTFDYYILTHSTANSPPTYSVHKTGEGQIRMIERNNRLSSTIQQYNFQPKEFFTFENREGDILNGYMIKPVDYNPNKKYPVFMFLYGGPGSQQVVDSWGGRYLAWFQMLAQKGYIIACVDNRGTGGRGEEFKKQTYLNLGKMETADQIDAANYLKKQPFTDPERFGVFGWSYGGYMSTNLILHGNEVYKMAIAVAPVTNWRWYDTIYTERYMRTVEENEAGYYDFSPVYFAEKLKGKYLLVHGLSDDNVHFQHTSEMARALINAGKDFQTMYYPNDNHAITGPGSRLHLFRLMTAFIKDNL